MVHIQQREREKGAFPQSPPVETHGNRKTKDNNKKKTQKREKKMETKKIKIKLRKTNK